MPKHPGWEPQFGGYRKVWLDNDPAPRPVAAPVSPPLPEFVPYRRRERDDERASREAARTLAALRARLGPDWRAWHDARPPVSTELGFREREWARFWRAAV